jgi:hypothetical protein
MLTYIPGAFIVIIFILACIADYKAVRDEKSRTTARHNRNVRVTWAELTEYDRVRIATIGGKR